MNKTDFVKTLSKELGFSLDKTTIINDILGDNFLVGKKNKNKIIKELSSRLKIDEKQASKIYDKAMEIIGKEIKNKIKDHFKVK